MSRANGCRRLDVWWGHVGTRNLSLVGDTVLLRFIYGPRGIQRFWRSRHYAFLRVARGEVIDTVIPEQGPRTDLNRAPYHADYHLVWMNDGSQVRGAGSELTVLIEGPEGASTIRLDSVPERVPLPASALQEIEEHRAWLERRGNRSAPFYPEPPTHMPVFERFLLSSNNEVWIERPVAGPEGMEYQMDVFDANGSQLAEVPIPPGLRIHTLL